VRLADEAVAQGPLNALGLMALLFGAGGVGTLVVKWGMRMLEGRWLGHHLAVAEAVSSIHDELERCRNRTGASRVVLLKSEDGGGVPSADRAVRTTAMYDSVEDPLPAMARGWVAVPADGSYAQVLAQLVRSGQVPVLTADLPEGSPLRDKYEAEGVARALFQLVGASRKAVFYLVGDYTAEAAVGAADRDNLRAAAGRVHQHLRRGSTFFRS
jgi:hypothetical protein